MGFKGIKQKWFVASGQVLSGFRKVTFNEKTICVLEATNFNTDEEFEANALLISKAPEMLEMLNHLGGRIDFSWDAWGSNEGIELSNKIEKLIKEATEL
jgi:hypothetical protein